MQSLDTFSSCSFFKFLLSFHDMEILPYKNTIIISRQILCILIQYSILKKFFILYYFFDNLFYFHYCVVWRGKNEFFLQFMWIYCSMYIFFCVDLCIFMQDHKHGQLLPIFCLFLKYTITKNWQCDCSMCTKNYCVIIVILEMY